MEVPSIYVSLPSSQEHKILSGLSRTSFDSQQSSTPFPREALHVCTYSSFSFAASAFDFSELINDSDGFHCFIFWRSFPAKAL